MSSATASLAERVCHGLDSIATGATQRYAFEQALFTGAPRATICCGCCRQGIVKPTKMYQRLKALRHLLDREDFTDCGSRSAPAEQQRRARAVAVADGTEVDQAMDRGRAPQPGFPVALQRYHAVEIDLACHAHAINGER